jgi:malonyl CoA-acyl carrier protein transacylase
VFTAMNRMLLENGMGLAILPEPKAAAGFSQQEFAAEIAKGQIAFQELTTG